MFTLKRLSRDGIESALQKAERYRLLNEPWEAESICRDVLELDPANRQALVTLLLSLTDRFGRPAGGAAVPAARELLSRLGDPYDRLYYEAIICERRGKAALNQGLPGNGPVVYDLLREAMDLYEQAERIRPPGNESAIVRWNTCARLIMGHDHVRPAAEERVTGMLE